MSQDHLPVVPINFNKPQLRLIFSRSKEAVSNWPRGIGKSTIIAWLLRKAALSMPRGTATLTGITYEQLLTRTLPSTFSALEKMGWYKDIHYWVGKQPPAKLRIERPYQRPGKYDHFITFYTGFGVHLVSQDRSTSARGLNTDLQITDESLLLDYDRYTQEVLATNRGNEEHFNKIDIHHGIFHFTSMPLGTEGSWILKKSEYYEEDNRDFNPVKDQIIKLQLDFLKNKNPNHRLEIHREIVELEKNLNFYTCKREGNHPMNGLFYSEATAWDNLVNVTIRYLEQEYRDMPLEIFLIEMLGLKKKKISDGFYPTFDRNLHGYKGGARYDLLDSYGDKFDQIVKVTSKKDDDCDLNLPLIISVDWGGKINSMVVAQHDEKLNEIRFIKALYVKHPFILDDLFQQFCDYYAGHPKRRIEFYFDKNGNAKLANSKLTFAEQGALILRKNRFDVDMKSTGANPFHNEKYLLFGRMFRQAALNPSQRDPRYPVIKFNLIKAKYAVLSIEGAGAKEHKGEIFKDKSSEASTVIPQEEAPHLSDAVDNILFHRFKHLIKDRSSLPAARMASTN